MLKVFKEVFNKDMAIKRISFSDIDLQKLDDIIDVRSPSEYEVDHIPGAINLPVLSDKEREMVGTIYKQNSKFEAKKLGAALISKNISNFLKELNKLKSKYPKIIKEVRGKGLLIGICVFKDQTKFIQKLIDNNLLTVRAAENVVRLLPPLNVTKQEINLGLKIIDKVCKNY